MKLVAATERKNTTVPIAKWMNLRFLIKASTLSGTSQYPSRKNGKKAIVREIARMFVNSFQKPIRRAADKLVMRIPRTFERGCIHNRHTINAKMYQLDRYGVKILSGIPSIMTQ
jgi:hypothetical protein